MPPLCRRREIIARLLLLACRAASAPGMMAAFSVSGLSARIDYFAALRSSIDIPICRHGLAAWHFCEIIEITIMSCCEEFCGIEIKATTYGSSVGKSALAVHLRLSVRSSGIMASASTGIFDDLLTCTYHRGINAASSRSVNILSC